MTAKASQTEKDSHAKSGRTMHESDRRLWPFRLRHSMIWVIMLLVGLLLLVATIRAYFGWPSDQSGNAVLIGVLVLSLLPILLPLLDIVIERGGVIEYGGVKIDFAQVRPMGVSGITVPVNIGVRGEPVSDSSTTQILDTLRQATTSNLVVIDLEAGQAWWETRLLVLLAGAIRSRKPERIVFVGTDAGREQCFQGWASAEDLLPHLAHAHPQYLRSLQRAMAAAKEWELVELSNPVSPGDPIPAPLQPPWMLPGLATKYPWMVFDNTKGLLNEFLAEQLLAADLGEQVEKKETPRSISLVRLDDLFRPVLYKDCIDQSWPSDQQISTFFQSDAPYFAVTQNGTYVTMVSRLAVLNEVLKSVVEQMPAR
jgi:hypothetical protein